MKIEFFPLDITYKEINDKPVIYIFGKTRSGEQVCIRDSSFKPYFKVICNPYAIEKIKEVTANKNNSFFSVTGIEEINTNLIEKPVKAFKVFVNLPRGVPVLKSIVRNIPEVEGVYEYDILYPRRYLIDKEIIPLSLCEVEAEQVNEKCRVPVFELKNISQLDEFPELRSLAVDIEVYNPLGRHIDMEKYPIVMISLFSKGFEKVLTWKRFPTKNKNIEFLNSEADMIQRFKELVEEFRPDILVGYNSDGFDLPYINTRAKKYKLKLDIGLDFSELNIDNRGFSKAEIRGIIHVDIFRFIRRIMRGMLDTDVFSLNAVSKEILGDSKQGIDIEALAENWDSASKKLEKYAEYNLHDSRLTYQLLEKFLPNIFEFIKIIGLPIFDINRMSFSQFVEWYCIKQAHFFNQIIPNKPGYYLEQQRMKDRVKGAFVFEPKPGLYDHIAVFDFRSLYPTIIASHNISSGTLNCECCRGENKIETDRGTFWFCKKKKGFLSSIIEDLITRRARIKEIMKEKDSPFLKARSNALKLLANSFYGYLGFASARWYCIECGESTTAWARQYIHKVIDSAKSKGFTVLYSDTDSVFLLLKDKSKDDAIKFADEINQNLPNLMELDFEGFFKTGIFVSVKSGSGGAKKKYAMLDDKDNIKVKGFEAVRRNSSSIAKEIQTTVLDILLREKKVDKAKKYVKDMIKDLRNFKIPLDKVIIKTQLTKNIADYESKGPHVAAAQRIMDKGGDIVPGMIVDFVIIKGKGLIRDKVRLPDEVTKEDYDPEYYVNHQIIPSVDRIFAVLGINISDIVDKDGEQKSLFSFK